MIWIGGVEDKASVEYNFLYYFIPLMQIRFTVSGLVAQSIQRNMVWIKH